MSDAEESDNEEINDRTSPERTSPDRVRELRSTTPQTERRYSAHHDEEGTVSEAKVRMELDRKRRQEKDLEELKEFEEMRKIEREKEEEEIRTLREKKEKRKKERAEEEKRMSERRAIEEQKRRAEEEERQRRKRDEEQTRKDEQERKRKEAEERTKKMNKPNFVIRKRIGGEEKLCTSATSEDQQNRSEEQQEAERKAILEQRIQPLSTDNLSVEQLTEKAKELHEKIYRIEGERYDLEQSYSHRQRELMELAEKARQMNKGGKPKATTVDENDTISQQMAGVPPKIKMFSTYERVKDYRSFGDKRTLYSGPIYGVDYEKVAAQRRIVLTDTGFVADGAAPNGVEENGAAPTVVADDAAEVAVADTTEE